MSLLYLLSLSHLLFLHTYLNLDFAAGSVVD